MKNYTSIQLMEMFDMDEIVTAKSYKIFNLKRMAFQQALLQDGIVAVCEGDGLRILDDPEMIYYAANYLDQAKAKIRKGLKVLACADHGKLDNHEQAEAIATRQKLAFINQSFKNLNDRNINL